MCAAESTVGNANVLHGLPRDGPTGVLLATGRFGPTPAGVKRGTEEIDREAGIPIPNAPVNIEEDPILLVAAGPIETAG